METKNEQISPIDPELSAFASLNEKEQDFVLLIVHGSSNAAAVRECWPEFTNPKDKGYRTRRRPEIIAAIEEVRSMRYAEQDLSRERMVDELLLLRERIRSVGESPKHLELELRIIQELNKMAGHITQHVHHLHQEIQPIEIVYEMPSQIIEETSVEPIEEKDTDTGTTESEASPSA
jgi:hypothetical protein